VKLSIRARLWLPPTSAFTGFRLPAEVIVVAVRWYLRFNLSYRDVEELLVERGTEQVIIAGHAFMQNLRNGHYELAVDATLAQRVATAFSELALAI
jgi:hypothetical protein